MPCRQPWFGLPSICRHDLFQLRMPLRVSEPRPRVSRRGPCQSCDSRNPTTFFRGTRSSKIGETRCTRPGLWCYSAKSKDSTTARTHIETAGALGNQCPSLRPDDESTPQWPDNQRSHVGSTTSHQLWTAASVLASSPSDSHTAGAELMRFLHATNQW